MEVLGYLIAILGLVGVIALVVVFSTLLRGFVLTKLWAWFIVPVFHLPQISLVQAIGVALVAGMLFSNYSLAKEEDDEKKKLTKSFSIIISPLVTLFIGWIVQMFM